jgi:hypothetical protein
LIPSSPDGRAEFLEDLAHRAYPTIEFFVFSVLAGAILGASFMLDSQALLFLGVLLAPVMMPWVGMVLATVTGSWRFFFQTLLGFLLGAVLIFVTGALAGFASRIFMPITLTQAFVHTRLWGPDLFVPLLGAILFPSPSSARRITHPAERHAGLRVLPASQRRGWPGKRRQGTLPDGRSFSNPRHAAVLVGIHSLFIGLRPTRWPGSPWEPPSSSFPS